MAATRRGDDGLLEVTESRVGEEGDPTDSEDNTPFKKADGRFQKEVAIKPNSTSDTVRRDKHRLTE